ncbi:acyl-CoA dehydrogenase family protein, partial [Stenotrophomonas maltophilia]
FGTEAQKAAYLPAVARGEKIAAFALTEPGSGSDVASMETSAATSGNGWRVNGAKTYISNGGIADYYVLFARTGEAPGARGISAFIV